MSEHETPNWQPISFLPNLAEMVDGMLESAEEVYHSLQQAQHRPHVLDDYTISRVRDVHTTQRNDLWLYEDRLSRWQDATPTPEERTEITRVQHRLDQLTSVLSSCLALVDALLQGAGGSGTTHSQIRLAEARDTIERWKAAELRDYFRDPCLAAKRQTASDTVPGALVVYPIPLPGRLELIAGREGKLSRHVVPIDGERYAAKVNDFRRLVEKRTTRQSLCLPAAFPLQSQE